MDRNPIIDEAMLGGLFTYTTSEGIAIATSNSATATASNNAISATSLSGTSGDDIIIVNHVGTLNGGGGNIRVATSTGSNIVTGGSGNSPS